MDSKNGCPFVSITPDVFNTPTVPPSFGYVANGGSGVACPGAHHNLAGPDCAPRPPIISVSAPTVTIPGSLREGVLWSIMNRLHGAIRAACAARSAASVYGRRPFR